MSRLIDLTGKRFGRLTVMKRVYKDGEKRAYWLCKCDCGNKTIVQSNHLRDGHTTSCGCVQKEVLKKRNTTHGLSETHIYKIYKAMKTRTTDENFKYYKHYGGRGIKVCDEWLRDFRKFYDWSINNGYKEGLTIDRIDNNGNYEPSNCRWTTNKEQQNNRRNNHYITYNGETHTMKQWSETLNINYSTLRNRINRSHWSIERAFTQ